MKKKIIYICLALLILIIPGVSKAQGEKEVKLQIHGKTVNSDVSSFIENGRTLVPIRVISEELGYKVIWDENDQTVTITNIKENGEFSKLFLLVINSDTVTNFKKDKLDEYLKDKDISTVDLNTALENASEKVKIDVKPKIVDGRTFVPIRVVAELLGEKVDWNQETWTVIIGE